MERGVSLLRKREKGSLKAFHFSAISKVFIFFPSSGCFYICAFSSSSVQVRFSSAVKQNIL